jgi:hypothetical protein
MSNIKLFSISDTISFGKHKGKTIKEIAIDDPSYVTWMLRNIPAFFVKPEDMLNLMLLNNELVMTDEFKQHYSSKKSTYDFECFMAMPQMEESLWKNIKTTAKNIKIEDEIVKLIYGYVLMNAIHAIPEASNESTWKFCQLGVEDDGCPSIRVFCDVTEQLLLKKNSEAAQIAHQGLLGENWHSQFYFDVSMDSPLFGAVAQRLLKLKLIRIKVNKDNLENRI